MPFFKTIVIDEAILRALRQAFPDAADYEMALCNLLGKPASNRDRGLDRPTDVRKRNKKQKSSLNR